MIIKKSGGRWQLSLLASVVISAFFLNTAYAWQQEYIVDTQPGHSTERYTWDSDHQPDYNDILSQRIQSSQRAAGTGSQSGGRNSCGCDQQYEYGLEFSFI